MKNYSEYISDYSDGNLSDKKRKWFEGELAQNSELRSEYFRFKQVNDFMRGMYDLDEVRNDPARQSINSMINQMITEFNENPSRYQNIQRFVESSIKYNENDSELQKQIDEITAEAEGLNLNKTTEKWVEEWNSKSQPEDLGTASRRAFISSALNDEDRTVNIKNASRSRTLVIRTTLLAVAAMIAAVFFVKTLDSSDSSDKLYKEYYKPLIANTSITRSTNVIDPFSNAVEMYKQGQYKSAATMFSDLMINDSNSTAVRFFVGITQLELGEYNQAITLLNEVVNKNREYKKEAQWYLGLAYLKIGETQKANSVIKVLAESKGYYQEQAQDLLNHLK